MSRRNAGVLGTLRLATHHGVVGHSPDRCGGSRTRRRYSPILYYLLSYYLYYLLAYITYSPILLTRLYYLLSYTTHSPILLTRLYHLLSYTTYSPILLTRLYYLLAYTSYYLLSHHQAART